MRQVVLVFKLHLTAGLDEYVWRKQYSRDPPKMRYRRKAVLRDDGELTTKVSGNSLRKSAKSLNSQQLVTPGLVAEQRGESINREAESRQNVQSDQSCIDEARQHQQQIDSSRGCQQGKTMVSWSMSGARAAVEPSSWFGEEAVLKRT